MFQKRFLALKGRADISRERQPPVLYESKGTLEG